MTKKKGEILREYYEKFYLCRILKLIKFQYKIYPF